MLVKTAHCKESIPLNGTAGAPENGGFNTCHLVGITMKQILELGKEVVFKWRIVVGTDDRRNIRIRLKPSPAPIY